MKTARIYIIAAICLIVGIALFFTGFAGVHFDITKLQTEPQYEEKTFVSSKSVGSIVIEDSNIGIDIVASEDDRVHITYYENSKEYYEINLSDTGILRAEKVNNRKWYDYFFNINFQMITMTLAIPESYTGNLSVKTSNGKITVENIQAKDMSLSSSNSGIKIDSVSFLGKLEADTSNGTIDLQNAAAQEDIACHTSNGKITLSNVTAKSIRTKSSNGKIQLKSVIAQKILSADTSNNSISLDTIEFGTSLSCTTSNGTVEGSISGKLADYTITSKTSNGKNNLPESMHSGEKRIDIKTSNSNIEIDFIEGV